MSHNLFSEGEQSVITNNSKRHKAHMYLFDDGFVFGCWQAKSETIRFTANLLIALDGAFEFGLRGEAEPFEAAAMRPLIKRCLGIENHPLLSIGITADHAEYRSFCAIAEPGYIGLQRGAFAHLRREMVELHRGALPPNEAFEITHQITHTAAQLLPRPKPMDKRVQQVLTLLRSDSRMPLEQLAAVAGLSYDRMSHLFSEEMGMPLRSYLLARKINTAGKLLHSGRSLTEIAHTAGFADSSHFSRAWFTAFGLPPSYLVGNGDVRVQTHLIKHAL